MDDGCSWLTWHAVSSLLLWSYFSSIASIARHFKLLYRRTVSCNTHTHSHTHRQSFQSKRLTASPMTILVLCASLSLAMSHFHLPPQPMPLQCFIFLHLQSPDSWWRVSPLRSARQLNQWSEWSAKETQVKCKVNKRMHFCLFSSYQSLSQMYREWLPRGHFVFECLHTHAHTVSYVILLSSNVSQTLLEFARLVSSRLVLVAAASQWQSQWRCSSKLKWASESRQKEK